MCSTDGSPVGDATIEIWQNGHDGLYTVQDLDRFPIEHLRGTYRSRADGTFEVRCLRPVDYPVPMDGPPGEMLDWEALTGGYLLTACFASGRAAARGALAWLKDAALPR